MTEQETEAKLPLNARRVLDILESAAKPLTAYEILDELRPFGVKAPPTAYRSLDRLLGLGLIHRLESLNAFIVCDRGGSHSPSAIAICTECRSTIEMHSDAMPALAGSWAADNGFEVSGMTIELHGLCAKCRAAKAAKN